MTCIRAFKVAVGATLVATGGSFVTPVQHRQTHCIFTAALLERSSLATVAHERRPELFSIPDEQQIILDNAAKKDLEEFARDCNPQIQYFDPLRLAGRQFWGTSNAATINFLRHAEMKHGRIAMLGFLGYIVQANHICFPWATEENGFPPIALSPPDQWDVLDPVAKFQLFFFIGLMEIWSEYAGVHYMKGGKPGRFPPFVNDDGSRVFGLPIDLWDPLHLTDTMNDQTKRIKLAKEVNNGRLAMLGMFGFLVESKVPGSVPLLSWLGVVQPYEGEYMLPFGYWDFILYFFERSDWTELIPGTMNDASDMTPW